MAYDNDLNYVQMYLIKDEELAVETLKELINFSFRGFDISLSIPRIGILVFNPNYVLEIHYLAQII